MIDNLKDSTHTLENINLRIENKLTLRLNQTQLIQNYFEQESRDISRNNRCIDNSKAQGSMRILLLNLHSYWPFKISKLYVLKEAIARLKIDLVLVNETNTKWASVNTSKIENELKL